MTFKITFWKRAPAEPEIEFRRGVNDSLEATRSYAKSKAERVYLDTDLIEVEGKGVSELWVFKDGNWVRDDNAQRP